MANSTDRSPLSADKLRVYRKDPMGERKGFTVSALRRDERRPLAGTSLAPETLRGGANRRASLAGRVANRCQPAAGYQPRLSKLEIEFRRKF